MLHVDSSGRARSDRRQRARRDLLRARKPRRLFPAGAGHDPLRRGQLHRHGIAKEPALSQPRPCAAPQDEAKKASACEARRRGARRLLRQPQQEGQGGQDRSAHRPRGRSGARDPDPLPPPQEQPAAGRRSRRRQDRDRRRPRAQDHRKAGAGSAGRRHDLLARHGRAAGRHPLSRRLRRAPEERHEGTGEPPQRRSCSSTRSTPSSAPARPAAGRWMPRTC